MLQRLLKTAIKTSRTTKTMNYCTLLSDCRNNMVLVINVIHILTSRHQSHATWPWPQRRPTPCRVESWSGQLFSTIHPRVANHHRLNYIRSNVGDGSFKFSMSLTRDAPIIGRLFGTDYRPTDNRPVRYRCIPILNTCQSTHNTMPIQQRWQ